MILFLSLVSRELPLGQSRIFSVSVWSEVVLKSSISVRIPLAVDLSVFDLWNIFKYSSRPSLTAPEFMLCSTYVQSSQSQRVTVILGRFFLAVSVPSSLC